jgi:hypothetical protein
MWDEEVTYYLPRRGCVVSTYPEGGYLILLNVFRAEMLRNLEDALCGCGCECDRGFVMLWYR